MNILVSIGILVTLLTGYVSPHQQLYSELHNIQRIQTGLFSDVQSKLDALETAYKAGILTEGEYTAKKTELEAQLRPAAPQMDEATKKKLQALNAAHQAGILSDTEYEQKKAALLEQPALPTTILYQSPQAKFQFQYPNDWNIQTMQGDPNSVTVARGKAAISIMPTPEGIADAQQMLGLIVTQIQGQWQNYKEVGRGQEKVGIQAAPMVEFTGINPEGTQAHGQIVIFISGTSGYMFIFIAPENDPVNGFAVVQPIWKNVLSSFSLVLNSFSVNNAGTAAILQPTGKIFRHPSGFSFQYPNDWNITEQEGSIQLIPPNATSTPEGPTELYFMAVEDVSAQNIQRPDDPMVMQFLDQQVKSLSPVLQQTGNAVPIKIRTGSGIVAEWSATAPGGEVLARAFVGKVGNNIVILLGMGLKDRIEARDKVLRQMFSTLGIGELRPSPNITPPQRIATSAPIAGNEVGDPNWGFKFLPPAGWKAQKNPEAAMLGHDTIAGAIFVLPHLDASLQAVQTEMQKGLTDEGVQLLPTGTVQPLGNNAFAGEYTGLFNGQQVKARGIGTFSPYGGGAYIIAVTTPDQYSPQLASAADTVAKSLQYFKTNVSDLMQHFAGRWATSTTNTLTNITLAPNGDYFDEYESSYSGDLTDGTFKTGDWGVAGQEQGKGRWTVRGTKQQGVIIITHADGDQSTLEYRVHVENGQTYWNEYIIDGSHYSKIVE